MFACYKTCFIMNNSLPPVNQRIYDLIEEISKGNKTAFSIELGYRSAQKINRLFIIDKRTDKYPVPSSTIISDISNTFDINPTWLLTGEGETYKSDKEEIPKISYSKGIPYFDVDFIGGFDLVVNDQTRNPEYYIDFQKYNNATCWCNVTGRSMEPEINHGDIIALKAIEDFSFLPLGEVYAIVTVNEMRTIKRVGKSQNGNYILYPTNKSPEYSPQELKPEMIYRVYQVLGCMKRL